MTTVYPSSASHTACHAGMPASSTVTTNAVGLTGVKVTSWPAGSANAVAISAWVNAAGLVTS